MLLLARMPATLLIFFISNLAFMAVSPPDKARETVLVRLGMAAGLLFCAALMRIDAARRRPVAFIVLLNWILNVGHAFLFLTTEQGYLFGLMLANLLLAVLLPLRWPLHVLAQVAALAFYVSLNSMVGGTPALTIITGQDFFIFLWFTGIADVSVALYERLHHAQFVTRCRLQESLAAIEQQNRVLQRDLDLAHDIQLGLLPDRIPWDTTRLAVHACSIPAAEVGGDFYTFVGYRETMAAAAIGDISGKGVSAALMTALLSANVEARAREIREPAALLATLNQQLLQRLRASRMNAALLYAQIDLQSLLACIANAGMIAPVLVRDGGVKLLDIGGLPLGSIEQAHYREIQVTLRPGDLLLLVSDGVVEARNATGELFGFERLEQAVAQGAQLSPRLLIEGLVEQVSSFMDGTLQHDDITLVALQPQL